MDRTYYRSRAGSVPGRDAENEAVVIETVLTQCIVSGVILLMVLLLCLVKTDLTKSMRESIKNALVNENGFNELVSALNIDYPIGAPAKEKIQAQESEQEDSLTGKDIPKETEPVINSRIDEDVLFEINNASDTVSG